MEKARLLIKGSSIHGYGVFAGEPIKKGQFLSELRGSKIHYKSSIHGQSNRYSNWFGVGKNTWIDPVDEFQYLNHSCNPTAGLMGSRKLRLFAMRDIDSNEEITIDYSTTEADPNFCFVNLEENCENFREYIGPIQTLPYEIYEKYLPFVPTYFQKIYTQEVLNDSANRSAILITTH